MCLEMRARGPDLWLSTNGDNSEEMALNQGAEGWDGDVKGEETGEEKMSNSCWGVVLTGFSSSACSKRPQSQP